MNATTTEPDHAKRITSPPAGGQRMTPTQAHRHFCDMLQKLRNMEPSPWPFLCAAAMLDYLAKMAIGSGKSAYKQFIRQYMKPEYRDFQFANGDRDLPEQVYHVLRCGWFTPSA